MANETTIAAGTIVRGSIEGTGNLVVAGHVEGDVVLTGEVTVESSGLVGANVRAARIVVRGAVRGDLSADEAVLLEEGARVVGDVRAARIAIGRGALVRGYVETANAGGAAPAPRREGNQARPAPRAAAPQAPKAAPAPKPAPARVAPSAAPAPRAPAREAAPPAPAPVARRPEPTPAAAPAPMQRIPVLGSSLKREPPPLVVPALKKGSRAVKKKSI
jgi:cytoskeletal protein CcmA (bactofilin family)